MDQNGSQYAVKHYINNIKRIFKGSGANKVEQATTRSNGQIQGWTGKNKVEQVISESEVDRHSIKTQFWVASLRGTKLEVVGISSIDS